MRGRQRGQTVTPPAYGANTSFNSNSKNYGGRYYDVHLKELRHHFIRVGKAIKANDPDMLKRSAQDAAAYASSHPGTQFAAIAPSSWWAIFSTKPPGSLRLLQHVVQEKWELLHRAEQQQQQQQKQPQQEGEGTPKRTAAEMLRSATQQKKPAPAWQQSGANPIVKKGPRGAPESAAARYASRRAEGILQMHGNGRRHDDGDSTDSAASSSSSASASSAAVEEEGEWEVPAGLPSSPDVGRAAPSAPPQPLPPPPGPAASRRELEAYALALSRENNRLSLELLVASEAREAEARERERQASADQCTINEMRLRVQQLVLEEAELRSAAGSLRVLVQRLRKSEEDLRSQVQRLHRGRPI